MKRIVLIALATVAVAGCATTPKTQTCPDGSVVAITTPCPPPPPPPPMTSCPDGTMVNAGTACPLPPPPPPPPIKRSGERG